MLKRQLLTYLALGYFLSGCTTADSPVLFDPVPVPSPAVQVPLQRVNLSAAASDVLALASVDLLFPNLDGVGDRLANQSADTAALPTLKLGNPNLNALALALAVTLKKEGSLSSPLGGSCLLSGGKAQFNNFKTDEVTVNGTVSFVYDSGDPSGDYTSHIHFANLLLSNAKATRRQVYSGDVLLGVQGTQGAFRYSWDNNLTVQGQLEQSPLASSAAQTVIYRSFHTDVVLTAQERSLKWSGELSLQNVRGLSLSLQIETPRPLQFSAAGALESGKVDSSVVGTSDRVTLVGQPGDLVVAAYNLSPSWPLAYGFLGGETKTRSALRSLSADLILRNGNILTMDDANPHAQALAIRDGRILRVGSSSEMSVLQGPQTEVVDLKGKTMLPGFVEPHTHYDLTALHMSATAQHNQVNGDVPANPALVDCGYYDRLNPTARLPSKASTLTLLSQALAAAPKALFGFNFDPSRLQASDRFQNFTRSDLDGLSTSVPIVVQNASGHISYANSAAFRAATINGQSLWPTAPNPPFQPPTLPFSAAEIVLDENGLPTGQLNEDAQVPLASVAIKGALSDPTQLANWLKNWRTMQESFANAGVTTAVHILLGANSALSVGLESGVIALLESRSDTPTRCIAYVNGQIPVDTLDLFSGEGDSRFRFIGAKFITDGSTQGFTAALNFNYLAPVPGFIFPAALNGLIDFATRAQLLAAVLPYYQRGFQLCFHANGDRAFELVVGVVSMLDDVATRRVRIEHFTVHQDSELDSHVLACKQLGLYPGLTIGHVFYWGKVFAEQILGEPANNIDPTQPLLESGVAVSLHSDSPVSPVFPLLYVQTAVTRLYQADPGQQPRVLGPANAVPNVMDALKCVTLNPAQACYSELDIGSLEAGKLADTLLLDQDPTAVDPTTIAQIPILQTRLGGRLTSGANP